MKNWDFIFQALPDEEQDKLALLRLIECSNGVAQHMFRNEDEDALSPEETRTAMKFSMGCMKTQTIPLGDEVITFAPETALIMKEVRKLYISGFKEQKGRKWWNDGCGKCKMMLECPGDGWKLGRK